MRYKFNKLVLTLIAIFFGIQVIASDQIDKKKILISKVVEHPALDATIRGIIDGLELQGFKQGTNIDIRIESAQASVTLASQIASKFVNQAPDIVIGVGTISAQSFIKYATDGKIKLVFSSITDPLNAGLMKNLSKSPNNISGVSNFIELRPQIELFQKLQPTLKRLGILYNPGETNSVSIVKHLEKLCPELGILLVKQAISKSTDVPQAAQKLASSVEAIFISNDNTALSALQSIIMIANKAKVPVHVSDTDAVALGALAALGPSQYQIGFQTSQIVADVLNGKDINDIPIIFPDKIDLYINETAAMINDIVISDDIRTVSTHIIKKNKL